MGFSIVVNNFSGLYFFTKNKCIQSVFYIENLYIIYFYLTVVLLLNKFNYKYNNYKYLYIY